IAKRSPPIPFDCGSTRPITALVAIAASTALPPRSRICTPARAANGWLAATMPYFVAIRDRPTTTLMCFILHISGVTLRSSQRFHTEEQRNGEPNGEDSKRMRPAVRRAPRSGGKGGDGRDHKPLRDRS